VGNLDPEIEHILVELETEVIIRLARLSKLSVHEDQVRELVKRFRNPRKVFDELETTNKSQSTGLFSRIRSLFRLSR